MLYSYVQCSVHPPPLPVMTRQGLVRRPMRGQELSGRLYAEHRSCREVIPLETLHVNTIGVGGIQWTREVSIISSIGQASCMGVRKHYRCFEAGPASMDPLSCSVCHLFLKQCSTDGSWRKEDVHNISDKSPQTSQLFDWNKDIRILLWYNRIKIDDVKGRLCYLFRGTGGGRLTTYL